MKSVVFDDGSRMVKIDGHILDQIFKYRQIGMLQKEAGGVLVGRELKSTDNLIIEKITEPMDLDKQSRFGFERKDPAHMDRFQELFILSGNTYGYFGEWHTHPEKVPYYSGIDKENWFKLYRELPRKHELIFVIAGTTAIGVWKVDLLLSSQPIYLFAADWDNLQAKECYSEK